MRYFKFCLLALALCISLITKSQDAKKLLVKSLNAHGGDNWNKIKYIKSRYIRQTNYLEQSERHEGPYITSYSDVDEIKHVVDGDIYLETKTLNILQPEWSSLKTIISGDKGIILVEDEVHPMPYSIFDELSRWIRYDPIQLLSKFQKLHDIEASEVRLHGIVHFRLSGIFNGLRTSLFINANTMLVAEAILETFEPYSFFYSPWGKYKTRIMFSLYDLFPNGLRYPRQWDIFKMGLLSSKTTFVSIDFDPKIDPEPFKRVDEIGIKSKKLKTIDDWPLDSAKVFQLTSGIGGVAGPWNVGWVVQSDGIVIVEAPMSSGYSKKIVSFLKEKYPGKRIKGVLVSSDAWPHIGGAREYVATEVPLYTHKLNEKVLGKLFQANYSLKPDNLEKTNNSPIFRYVTQAVTLKDKEVPMVIAPVNGEGGERMLLAYFPNQKVLYASDLLNKDRSGAFAFPDYVLDVKNTVDRYNWEVETFFAMHLAPESWSHVLDFLKRYEKAE